MKYYDLEALNCASEAVRIVLKTNKYNKYVYF